MRKLKTLRNFSGDDESPINCAWRNYWRREESFLWWICSCEARIDVSTHNLASQFREKLQPSLEKCSFFPSSLSSIHELSTKKASSSSHEASYFIKFQTFFRFFSSASTELLAFRDAANRKRREENGATRMKSWKLKSEWKEWKICKFHSFVLLFLSSAARFHLQCMFTRRKHRGWTGREASRMKIINIFMSSLCFHSTLAKNPGKISLRSCMQLTAKILIFRPLSTEHNSLFYSFSSPVVCRLMKLFNGARSPALVVRRRDEALQLQFAPRSHHDSSFVIIWETKTQGNEKFFLLLFVLPSPLFFNIPRKSLWRQKKNIKMKMSSLPRFTLIVKLIFTLTSSSDPSSELCHSPPMTEDFN